MEDLIARYVRLLKRGCNLTQNAHILGDEPSEDGLNTFPRQIGPATDVYGLGALLYEILTGQAPFTGASVEEIVRKVSQEPPIPPRKIVAATAPATTAPAAPAAATPAAATPAPLSSRRRLTLRLSGSSLGCIVRPSVMVAGAATSRYIT